MKVLLVHNHLASFVQTDIDLLKSVHEIRVNHFQRHNSSIARSFSNAREDVIWSDVVVSWFGGFHAFVVGNIARLLRKPHIIIASGYDVANVPEINYGNMQPGLKRYMGHLTFRSAASILPVSYFTDSELKRNVPLSTSCKVAVVPHGFSLNDEFHGGRAPNLLVMIASLNSEAQRRKGIDTFIKAARLLPDVEFVLIGGASDGSLERIRSTASHNLNATGYVDDLNYWLRKAKAYAQLSRHEAFGCGLAEAMIQGCVPVVTDCAALPEVAGDTGFYTKYGDVDATVRAIQQALATPPGYGARARERIMTEFPLEKRRVKLLAALDAVRLSK